MKHRSFDSCIKILSVQKIWKRATFFDLLRFPIAYFSMTTSLNPRYLSKAPYHLRQLPLEHLSFDPSIKILGVRKVQCVPFIKFNLDNPSHSPKKVNALTPFLSFSVDCSTLKKTFSLKIFQIVPLFVRKKQNVLPLSICVVNQTQVSSRLQCSFLPTWTHRNVFELW